MKRCSPFWLVEDSVSEQIIYISVFDQCGEQANFCTIWCIPQSWHDKGSPLPVIWTFLYFWMILQTIQCIEPMCQESWKGDRRYWDSSKIDGWPMSSMAERVDPAWQRGLTHGQHGREGWPSMAERVDPAWQRGLTHVLHGREGWPMSSMAERVDRCPAWQRGLTDVQHGSEVWPSMAERVEPWQVQIHSTIFTLIILNYLCYVHRCIQGIVLPNEAQFEIFSLCKIQPGLHCDKSW
jgi:hypothetical protein